MGALARGAPAQVKLRSLPASACPAANHSKQTDAHLPAMRRAKDPVGYDADVPPPTAGQERPLYRDEQRR